MPSLSVADVAIVVVSLLLVFAAAIYSFLKTRSRENEASEYFLAGRSMPWSIIACSLFASNIGAEHFVGQAGAAATVGMAVSLYEWTAAYVILTLGWIFAPVYLGSKLQTIPEYLERRFNKHCRCLFVLLTLVAYVVTKIGATLYAGSIILEVLAGMTIWQSTPLIILVTASYTVTGGLTAVMLTDTVQSLIFLLGGLLGTGFSLHLVGGLSGMFEDLRSADIGLSRLTHVLLPADDRDAPWVGMLFGIPIVSLWYWCIDQEMAQRVLSAKSLPHARMGTAIAGLAKIIPPFITVVPGLVARTLFELCRIDDAVFPEWCAQDLSSAREADRAYPLLVLREFPSGVRGIMVASFLAAMMSSLSSVYNSASTIFTYDVYERFAEGSSSAHKLVQVGRGVTVVLTVLTLMWLPVVEHSSRGLYVVGQEAMTHLVPVISAVFVCGLFVPFANGLGALTGMISGIVFGIARLIPYLLLQDYCDDRVDAATNSQNFNSFSWIFCLNFNYFGLVAYALTLAVICGVSLLSDRPSESQLYGLLSDLIRLWPRETGEVQLTNVQYNAMSAIGPSDVGQNGTELEAVSRESSLDKGTGEKPTVSIDRQSRLATCLSVEEGYAAHILTAVTIVGISLLIAVFH